MACLFGHKWNGCKCTKCGKTRDEGHDWDGCKCKICGKTRDAGRSRKSCQDRCLRCGKTQAGQHTWDGCKCKKCGKTRDEGHDWDGNKCKICGKTKDTGSSKGFPPFTGNGVCDVCNQPLNGISAYIVPNNVFYRSQKYRNQQRNSPMAKMMGIPMPDSYFEQNMARDNSVGSAVCENCIHLFP
jgi:hypothetical protein